MSKILIDQAQCNWKKSTQVKHTRKSQQKKILLEKKRKSYNFQGMFSTGSDYMVCRIMEVAYQDIISKADSKNKIQFLNMQVMKQFFE